MIILLFSLLAYFITYSDAHKERERIIKTNLDRTSNIAGDIDGFINNNFHIMDIISSISDKDHVWRLITREENISSFLLLDHNGTIIQEIHKDLEPKEQQALLNRYMIPYFQYPLKGERFVSNVVENKDINQGLIVLAGPVFKEDIVTGVAYLTLKIDAFIPLLKDYHIGKEGYVFLRDESGDTIYHPERKELKAQNYKFFDVSLIPRSDHKIQKSSFDNKVKYITYRPLKSAPWMVFIMQPIAEYQSPIYLIWLKNGALLLALFLFMYLLYDLEQKEKRLLQTQLNNERLEVVAEVAAGIAHEIKNPLVPIKGFIQLEKMRGDSTIGQENIRLLLNEIGRIETIINDFMTLARNNQSNYSQVYLRDLLRDLFSLMQVEADNKDIRLITNVFSLPEEILVYGDANQLTQVFLNIIKNSLEATAGDGTIEVNVRTKNKEVRVTVKDTGEGMSQEKLRKVGTPFYSTKEQGTGMGIAICQRIVKNHKGRIIIISQENKGTTIDVYLPLE